MRDVGRSGSEDATDPEDLSEAPGLGRKVVFPSPSRPLQGLVRCSGRRVTRSFLGLRGRGKTLFRLGTAHVRERVPVC